MLIQNAKWLQEVLKKNNLTVGEESIVLLESYVTKLLAWNEKINLISRTSTEKIWSEHILHSLSPLISGVIPPKVKILDLGSGGGLPGVPISIVLFDSHVTLIDSINKKMNAVKEIVSDLKLRNVVVRAGRAEEILELRESFDLVLARGVAPLVDLVRWSRPLLKRNGPRSLIAYKGGDLAKEISEASRQIGKAKITSVDLKICGADELNSSEKKLLIANL